MLFDWSHPNATANPPPPSLRFWVDAPSSIPVEIINLLVNVKALGLIRLVRMLRLIRLVKLLARLLELLKRGQVAGRAIF